MLRTFRATPFVASCLSGQASDEDGPADDHADRSHRRVRLGHHEESVVRLRAQDLAARCEHGFPDAIDQCFTLAETIAAVRTFVEVPLASAANGSPAPGTW